MNSSVEHILIACYDFPPNQGIGGRRWAKLAKGLAQKGFQVHVVKADPIRENNTSPWVDDTLHPNIHIYSLPRKYPEVISHPGNSIFQKILYRIQKARLFLKENGTIYDIAIGWEGVFKNQVELLISKYKIRHVLATGAPFNLLVYSAKLKQDHPSLKLLVDYRDPWLTATNMGMPFLSPKRKAAEIEKEKFVFSQADIVTFPNEYLLEEVRNGLSKGVDSTAKFETIPHFFDPEDIGDTSRMASPKIKLVYGGEIYIGVSKWLDAFRLYLKDLKENNPELYKNLQVKIYTHSPAARLGWTDDEVIKWEKPIGKKIFEEIRSANFCLLLVADHNKDFRTTKFQEYLPFSVPYLHIGEKGAVSDFILQNNLGFVINDFDQDLTPLLLESTKRNISVEGAAKIVDQYSLQANTDLLCDLLEIRVKN